MTVTTLTVPNWHINIDRDGPAAIEWWETDETTGDAIARAATLVCVITDGTTTITKTVGGGITLTDYDGVTGSYVSLQLTTAELASFKSGNFQTHEWREGASDPKRVLLRGDLILS